MSTSKLQLWCDGSCPSNGIAGAAARAGAGVFCAPGSDLNISERLPAEFGAPTNQKAELYAAIRAVQVGRGRVAAAEGGGRGTTLSIAVDSEYV